MNNNVRLALRVILPLIVIGLGFGASRKLIDAKKKSGKKPAAKQVAVVKVVEPKAVSRPLSIQAQGEVVAARSLVVQPQVSGKVLEVHPALVPGGQVAAGDTLLRIERVDYDLRVAQARAQLETAKQALELEKGRKVVADREWKLVNKDRTSKASAAARARALREPQIRQAQAQVDAAKAALRQARVNAGRATIKAPFNAMVLQEGVELGQVVGPGAQAARLVGTDAFWVQVSVPVGDLSWLDVPRAQGAKGAAAKITLHTSGAPIEREGHVVRLLGDLDPVGRMARLVVEVSDPLGLSSGQAPLLLGAFVDVTLTGKRIADAWEVPRLALHEGDQVWVYADGKLAMRDTTVTRRLRDVVLLSKGLAPGDKVITTRLSTPVPGMALRLEGEPAPEAAPTSQKPGETKAPEKAAGAATPASRAEVR